MKKTFKPVKKAVILAAGWGTRFLPLTKTIHKELVPVLNKPIIHYLAQEAASAGIEEVILVISPRKLDIIKYFTLNDPLESELREKGKVTLLKKVVETNQLVKVSIAIQNKQLGIGHAISVAYDLLRDEPFAVILGDDLFVSKRPAIGQLIDAYNQTGSTIIGVQNVSAEKVHLYGVVKPTVNSSREGNLFQISGAVEKPSPDKAPSHYAVMGRYVFTPKVMEILLELKRGWQSKRGELNVIDALDKLQQGHEKVYAFELEGQRYDLGSMEGFVKANIDLALKDPEIGPAISDHIRTNAKKILAS
ncbi:UTP--glucose-1-phosphate uridylyltransferase [Mycoplasma sp. ATU-Cv-703]|uniref:sugar phosphate nucleotidyltransferase n=1 Tax=Mycoplasma sp. ATU-Cv-703 TaxID=2498595 RepID=UPI000FDE241B